MKHAGLVIALSALSACQSIADGTNKAYDNTRRAVYDSAGKIQELTEYHPEPTAVYPPQSGYCYKTLADIICYDTPQPNITNKLIGYQGDDPNYHYPSPVPSAAYNAPYGQMSQPSTDINANTTPFYASNSPYVAPNGGRVVAPRAMVTDKQEIIVEDVPVQTVIPGNSANITSPAPAPNQPNPGYPSRLMPRM